MAAASRNPLLQAVLRYESSKVNVWQGIRNAIGVALPLLICIAIGAVPAGLAVATGALNVSFSDSREPYRQRARRMFAASILVGLAVFIGALTGPSNYIVVLVSAGWAFGAGMMVALSTAAADLGATSLVTLVVYMAVPQTPEHAVYAGLLAFTGGLFQTALSLASWPLRRYSAERSALANLYRALARAAESPIQATLSPPASAQSTQAQNVLASLATSHTLEAERYRLLLSQAERMRLSLMMLGRLRTRLGREDDGQAAAAILDRYFEAASAAIDCIAKALDAGELSKTGVECAPKLDLLPEQLREPRHSQSPALSATVEDARALMDALAGQLRTAVELAGSATLAGFEEFERREARRPWNLRLSGTLATLRANLTLDSAACRHAIRLSVCVGAGEALARGLELRRAYWLPMTIAIVLKPDFTATFSRGVLRLIGTFVGLVVATGLFHVLPGGLYVDAVVVGLSMFVMRAYGPANYGIVVVPVTAIVVLLIAMNGTAPQPVMAARGLNTAIGGVVALFAYWIWPTWERTQIRDLIARMLDSYRAYFHAVRKSFENPDKDFASERDSARVAARLARSNVEASIDRMFAEPGTPPTVLHVLSGVLASSHRMVHAMMALEAGLTTSRPAPVRAPFRKFADDVELSLYHLAAALRGSPLEPEMLADLREDHHALLEAGGGEVERYALSNIETDRITNSLNTLAAELLAWLNPTKSALPHFLPDSK